MKQTENVIGSWAFLLSVILAAVVGFLQLDYEWVAVMLVGFGVTVGLLNINVHETKEFLHVSAILVIVVSLSNGVVGGQETGIFSIIGPWAQGILDAFMLVFVPATIIVALRQVFAIAQD